MTELCLSDAPAIRFRAAAAWPNARHRAAQIEAACRCVAHLAQGVGAPGALVRGLLSQLRRLDDGASQISRFIVIAHQAKGQHGHVVQRPNSVHLTQTKCTQRTAMAIHLRIGSVAYRFCAVFAACVYDLLVCHVVSLGRLEFGDCFGQFGIRVAGGLGFGLQGSGGGNQSLQGGGSASSAISLYGVADLDSLDCELVDSGHVVSPGLLASTALPMGINVIRSNANCKH